MCIYTHLSDKFEMINNQINIIKIKDITENIFIFVNCKFIISFKICFRLTAVHRTYIIKMYEHIIPIYLLLSLKSYGLNV